MPFHPRGQPLTWAYDGNDNPLQMQTPWGLFQYGYDARDQRISLADPGFPASGLPAGRATWLYDARKQPIRQDNPNGTTTTTLYDPVMRPLQVRHATRAGAEIEHAYLQYDAAGRPRVKDTQSARFTFGYDAVDRLVSEQALGGSISLNTSFVYDQVGRRIGSYHQGHLTTLIYDAADQLLTTQLPLSGLIYQIDCGGHSLRRRRLLQQRERHVRRFLDFHRRSHPCAQPRSPRLLPE